MRIGAIGGLGSLTKKIKGFRPVSAFINDDGGNARYNDTQSFDTGTLYTKMTLSFWLKREDLTSKFIHAFSSGIGLVIRPTGGSIQVTAADAGGVVAFNIDYSVSFVIDKWNHFLLMVDMAEATSTTGIKLILDGVDQGAPDTTTEYVQDNDFKVTGWFGGFTVNNPIFTHWGEWWMDLGTAHTLDAAFIAKFIKGNKPVFLGATGELPTGIQPEVCYASDINRADMYINKGSYVKTLVESGTAFAEGDPITAAGLA